MRRRLETLFRPSKGLAYQRVLGLPEIKKVTAEGDKRTLLIVSPDSVHPPADVMRFYGALVEKNRSEEHTSELQSLMRISYAVFCLKKKTKYINYAMWKHYNEYNTNKTTNSKCNNISIQT